MNDFESILSTLCANPGRYTRHGKYWEIVAFIDGFDYARSLTFQRSETERDGSRFGDWLEQRSANPQNAHWAFLLLAECGKDESLALRRLPELYGEFLRVEAKPTDREAPGADEAAT